MSIVLAVLGVVLAGVAALAVWLVWAAAAGGRRSYARLAARIEPVPSRLAAGQDPDPGDIERFARDRTTRRVLYDALAEHRRLDLFPAEHRTPAALAEADLVLWLAHPNELGAVPDDIELAATVPDPSPGAGEEQYFVFRYRVEPPHWAAADGWLAGVAGPWTAEAPAVPGASRAFSKFERFESRTPEEHVAAVLSLIRDRATR